MILMLVENVMHDTYKADHFVKAASFKAAACFAYLPASAEDRHSACSPFMWRACTSERDVLTEHSL